MSTLGKLVGLGLWLAPLYAQCDSLRLAYGGSWHYNGDTLHIQGGFLTAYPRIYGPASNTVTWF